MEKQRLHMDSKHLIKILACLGVILLFWMLPPFSPITASGMKAIGVFIGTVLLLSIVDTLWPVFLSFALLSLTGILNLNEVLAGSIGSWIITFVILSFVITSALNEVGFTSRLTAYYMSRKFVSKSPWIFTFAFFGIAWFVALFMDQVAVTTFFLGLVTKILKELGYGKKDRYSHMMTMGTIFSVNIGGAATPISHSLSLLGMGIYEQATGKTISMFDYMFYGVPVSIFILVILWLILYLVFKPNMSNFKSFDLSKVLEQQKPMDLREKITILIFVITVILWMLPGLMGLVLPVGAPALVAINKFPITFWTLLAVCALAVIRINDKPLIDLKNTIEDKFPWGIILFISIGVLLGSVVSDSDVGLNDFIMENLTPILDGIPTLAIVFIFAFATTVLTNFASNVTTITLMTGVALMIAQSTGMLHPVAIALTTTMCGSLAFVMPSSFAPIAILHADENSDGGTVIRYGAIMVLVSSLIATFVGYPLITYFL